MTTTKPTTIERGTWGELIFSPAVEGYYVIQRTPGPLPERYRAFPCFTGRELGLMKQCDPALLRATYQAKRLFGGTIIDYRR